MAKQKTIISYNQSKPSSVKLVFLRIFIKKD